ncbi:hypothetical protein ACN9MZ_23095 [Pseudoduganella sp. S-14]|jgi:hypothetical protein|uniref:hypothetical protein n=1 Tax=Pseudoduganella sp. S-14 TaxID=3404065 RepID=UPI003CF2634D
MNIDRHSRNQLAEAIRALASGLITNDEFERKRMPHNMSDPAVNEVFSSGAWCLYSDLKAYRLTGKQKLDGPTRKEIARWVLFLKTDLPYEWPVPTFQESFFRFFGNLFTFGRFNRRYQNEIALLGDTEVWPFLRRSDFEAALRDPKYLNAI